ncbi:Resolvase domain [Candidatus Filomicrobium marinum]|uniref:Resolvase domain n=2 Tax=Filomicrobium TaxID=119044 RepID=A0A0D6JFZ7_9HYPH|nr:Resolvase domain [Candidatus Filomicrobium marinum]CPR19062.1 Resolvase domain [Candidatus Filomicrobium marinum]
MTAATPLPSTGPKAVIYCRVSDPKQVTRGSGLGSQETRCREYAGYRRYEVVKVFADEGVSGGLIDRPGMQAMLRFLRKNKRHHSHIVIIDDISRLARDLMAHIQLRAAIGEAGGKLESPSIEFGEDSDSRLVENMLASVSQHQRQKNAEQTKNRMRARAQSGYYVFIPPLGYRYDRVSGHGKMLVPDEPAASVIRDIFERFADGRLESQAEVARYLERFPDFPLWHKGRIYLQRIREVFERPIYAGYIDIPLWGIVLQKGRHEPLVSFETFQKVQERLSGPPKAPVRKSTTEDFLLRGFTTCGECGHPMTAAFSKGRNAHYGYYFCQQKGCSAFRKNIRKEDVEKAFDHLVARLRPDPKAFVLMRELLRRAFDDRQATMTAQTTGARAERAKIERQMERVMERLIETDDAALMSAFEAQLRKLQERKLILSEKLKSGTAEKSSFDETYRTALSFLANPRELWDSDDPADRNLFLKLVFTDKLPYHRNGGYRTAPTACIFKAIEGSNDNMFGMVPRAGIEPATP